jgi:hypothetical protein
MSRHPFQHEGQFSNFRFKLNMMPILITLEKNICKLGSFIEKASERCSYLMAF